MSFNTLPPAEKIECPYCRKLVDYQDWHHVTIDITALSDVQRKFIILRCMNGN